jgi:hypothetical protein
MWDMDHPSLGSDTNIFRKIFVSPELIDVFLLHLIHMYYTQAANGAAKFVVS